MTQSAESAALSFSSDHDLRVVRAPFGLHTQHGVG